MGSLAWNRLRRWRFELALCRIGGVDDFDGGVALIHQAPGLVVRGEQVVDRVEQALIIGASLGEKGGALRRFTFQRGVEEVFDFGQAVGRIHRKAPSLISIRYAARRARNSSSVPP